MCGDWNKIHTNATKTHLYINNYSCLVPQPAFKVEVMQGSMY